ncbi:hypothetical protein QN277_001431 [Acacia crassicarpa]|uniref:F-box domain-containing protein n=1 Tax=Acacia crassicarpa TaxID=499986 RepID=A0AAE1N9P0_9FABA|nr:hypothetical protein QN277_001431 [Acacia crassicarpa]
MEATGKDLLSDLLDEMLHHILSFLGDNPIVRLQSLSRRFQTICLTSPSLCLRHRPPGSFSLRYSSRNCSCRHVSNFMNSVLQHRPRALKINKVSFSSFCKRSRHRKLHTHWILNLHEAFLVDELSVEYQLPCVFKILPRLGSLKVLKLDMLRCFSVKLPVMKLTSLETLYMRCIVPDDPTDEWVSQSFPSLKHLSLIDVFVKKKDVMKTKQRGLTIRSSCLEDLVIHRCCCYKTFRVITENLRALSYATCESYHCYHRVDEDELSLEISAPLLQTFSLDGFPGQLRCEGTFKNLNIASLTETDRLSSTQLNSCIHLSKALCKGTILHTDMRLLEGLYKIRKTPISFENIRHVQIQISRWWWIYAYDTGDMVSNFLERSLPNVETLTLMNDSSKAIVEKVHRYDEEIVRVCGVAERREIKRLRKVEFIIREMNEMMAFLIGVLKEWCVDLEEMILNYPSHYHKSITRYLESFDMAYNYAPLSINFLLDD